MHDYHVVGFSRLQSYYWLALITSFAFAQILLVPSWFEQNAPTAAKILQAIVPSISGFAVYLIGYLAFSKWVWKWKLVQKLLPKVPDLDGVWEGQVQPLLRDGQPADQRPAPTEVIVVIEQTFDKISITLETISREARSVSVMARMERRDDYQVDLVFGYRGESTKAGVYKRYSGSNSLTFRRDGTNRVAFPIATGVYYTDEVRGTRGKIELAYSHRRQ